MGVFLRPEFWIIVVVALLIFGPKKLPEMGSSIGKTIREFQKSMREVKEQQDEPNAAVSPAAPTAQISAPAATLAPETPAAVPQPSVAAPVAAPAAPATPAAPAVTTPTADPLPPVGTTVE